jgi:hypothetical protein
LPARLCQRVALSIFLCFFLRIRLRRFLINDPMAGCQLSRSGRMCWWRPRRIAGSPGLISGERCRRCPRPCSWSGPWEEGRRGGEPVPLIRANAGERM